MFKHIKGKNILVMGIIILLSFGMISHAFALHLDPPYFEGEILLTNNSVSRVYADSSSTYYTISGTSALAALDAASHLAGFNYAINDEWVDSFGLFVYTIAGKTNEGYDGWQYWVNYPYEEIPMVSAENYALEQGDTIDWFYGGYGINPDGSEMDIKLHIKIQEDTTPPNIDLISPKKGGIYLYGSELSVLPLPFAIVLGNFHVSINAYDETSSVHKVELYIDDELRENMFTAPFHCIFTGLGSGLHTLKIIVFDSVGNTATKEIDCILLSN